MAGRFPLSDLVAHLLVGNRAGGTVDLLADGVDLVEQRQLLVVERLDVGSPAVGQRDHLVSEFLGALGALALVLAGPGRSEEHTSELQSLMSTSYAVYCLKKNHTNYRTHTYN